VPYLIEFLLLLFPVMGVAKIATNSIAQNQSIALSRLRFITACYSLLVGLLLALISLIGFKFGWWISVTPAMFGIFLSWIVINNYCQSKRERENFNNLIFVIKDLDHNLYNISGHFGRSTRDITRCRQAIIQEIENDLEINGMSEVTVSETNFSPSLEQIYLCVKNIERETIRIDRYRKRASEFLKCVYSTQHSVAQIANFNEIVKQTVKNLLTQHSYPYQIYIQEQYDNSISNTKLYIEALEIIVESILDNAFFAVNPTLNNHEGYTPQIKVATVNAGQFIQIIIKDNGSGIPKQRHSQIFLPRVSFKNDGGRGIGLYLVSQIVNYWQGTMELESEVGQGSCFTISLPKLG
jgi:signal transduction histidine kinase